MLDNLLNVSYAKGHVSNFILCDSSEVPLKVSLRTMILVLLEPVASTSPFHSDR